MKTENTIIPITLMAILVLGSLAPVVQIILLYGSAIYFYPFEMIFGIEDLRALNLMNLLGGILTVYGFYRARKTVFKLLWSVLAVFFFNSFFTFLWDDKGGDPNPYFLGFMLSGILTSLPLLIVGFLKEKRGLE